MIMIDPVWTCKDGREIAIPKLDEIHLVNIVEMLRRQHRRRSGSQALDENELPADENFFGVGVLELEDDDFLRATYPIFNDLLWECFSRGLMDGDTGEWLRTPGLGEVSVLSQLEITQRIIECSTK